MRTTFTVISKNCAVKFDSNNNSDRAIKSRPSQENSASRVVFKMQSILFCTKTKLSLDIYRFLSSLGCNSAEKLFEMSFHVRTQIAASVALFPIFVSIINQGFGLLVITALRSPSLI